MASAMGSALRRHVTVRPSLVLVMSPASDSTFRCFSTAGRDIEKGSAKVLTGMPSASGSRRASRARRVGSARAANVRSSVASE